MESVWIFKLGLRFLIHSISKTKQSKYFEMAGYTLKPKVIQIKIKLNVLHVFNMVYDLRRNKPKNMKNVNVNLMIQVSSLLSINIPCQWHPL